MALFTTFITTPTVMAIYKPARGRGISTRPHRKLRDLTSSPNAKEELRLLACVHGSGNAPGLISLIESTRSTKKSLLIKLFVLRLVELTERSSSIIMVQRVRRNGFPIFNRFRRGDRHDQLAGAFQAYNQLGRVSVRPTTAISALSTMHQDICHVAEDKRVTMIILPLNKQWRGEGDETEENVGNKWREVNQRVLKNAPCSVAVLVDRGFGSGAQTPGPTTSVAQRVCIIFFGGPDDREALELGGRMVEHPAVKVTVIRFVEREGKESNGVMLRLAPSEVNKQNYSFSTATMNRETEKELDETAIAEFRSKSDGTAEYSEKEASNIIEGVLGIGRSGKYQLIIVGKGRFPSTMVAGLAEREAEHAELGPVGDILSSSGHGIVSSVLVIQQHDLAHVEEAPVSKVVRHRADESSTSVRDISNDNV